MFKLFDEMHFCMRENNKGLNSLLLYNPHNRLHNFFLSKRKVKPTLHLHFSLNFNTDIIYRSNDRQATYKYINKVEKQAGIWTTALSRHL